MLCWQQDMPLAMEAPIFLFIILIKVGNSTTLQQANDVLREILVENIGDGTELMEADWKEMFQNRCIVMQYDFMITMEEYLSEMRSLKNGQPLEEFDY